MPSTFFKKQGFLSHYNMRTHRVFLLNNLVHLYSNYLFNNVIFHPESKHELFYIFSFSFHCICNSTLWIVVKIGDHWFKKLWVLWRMKHEQILKYYLQLLQILFWDVNVGQEQQPNTLQNHTGDREGGWGMRGVEGGLWSCPDRNWKSKVWIEADRQTAGRL